MKEKANIFNLLPEDMKLIMDHSYDEIFVTDQHCRIIYVNPACSRNYGPEPEEIIGKTVYEMEALGYYSPALAPIVLQRKETVTMEQVTRFDKKLLVTATPVFDEDKEIRIIVMNSRDITELEKLKYDVEETKKLLGHYEKEIEVLQNNELNVAGIITKSPALLACYRTAKKTAKTDATVLILGESGVGKNVYATYIHNTSARKDGPFIQINCAAIPENLLESELFGYCTGAFSGAERGGKKGLAELAHKGTLFLDEVGELPYGLQAKLLQLVQSKTFLPIGGKELKQVDIRIISATNQNLKELVKAKKFREDLYFRLNVIEVTIPPLRQRKEDIPQLVNYFVNKINIRHKTYGIVDPEIFPVLKGYHWPGNIRELEHVLERLILTVDNEIISAKHLPTAIMEGANEQGDSPEHMTLNYKNREIEQILALYKEYHSSYKVAERLNISQSKANRIIREHLKEKSITFEE